MENEKCILTRIHFSVEYTRKGSASEADFIDYYADAEDCTPASWYFHSMKDLFISLSIYLYIYIYIYRERERESYLYIYIYILTVIIIYCAIPYSVFCISVYSAGELVLPLHEGQMIKRSK